MKNYSEITPYISKLAEISTENNNIAPDMYIKHKVNRGLRDVNGNGVVTGLTEVSKIIAKENECSALRRKDPGKAYFNCHTDITIPYEELDEIAVIQKDGTKVPIIQKGRFVLPGTEELNVPLDEWK